MLDNVSIMMEDKLVALSGLKKERYESNVEVFGEKHAAYFDEMLGIVAESDDKEAAAAAIAECFVTQVFDAYSKNGKVKSRLQMDLNYMMIYYFFPVMLLKEDENRTLICDAVRDKWNEVFRTTINYADYETIKSGFKRKIFGFIIE